MVAGLDPEGEITIQNITIIRWPVRVDAVRDERKLVLGDFR